MRVSLLARLGTKSLTIARHPTTALEPRATITNQRTAEILRDIGLEERWGVIGMPLPAVATTWWPRVSPTGSCSGTGVTARERSQLAYPLRSLLGAGIPATGSSDSPVSSYQPLLGIQAAVTEKTMSGADFAPGEALSVEEAIGLYTRNAAHAAFDEHIKGTVAPGKYADLTVLTEDPRAVPPEAIAAITVTATIQEASCL